MKLRILTALLAVITLVACPSLENTSGKKKAKGPYETDIPPIPTKDQSGDMTFQSFVGRLRTAVERRDLPTLSQMMAKDFGYRWDTAPTDENPFTYWDRQNLWGELAGLLRDKWVPYNGFMVVPPQLALDGNYGGYRAGVKMVNGSWQFAYFVAAPPAQ
jgi:hypothetical protein